MELKEIINALKQIRTETKTKVSDEVLWDSAVRIFNSNKINSTNNSEKATDKQIKLLRDLKVKFNESISKQEAKKLIDSTLKNRKK